MAVKMNEFPHEMLGIKGRMTRIEWPQPGRRGKVTFMHQKFVASRRFMDDGINKTLAVEVRFDDNCRNGHNDFAITATLYNPLQNPKIYGDRVESCGCLHDEVAEVFPELAHLIQWHLHSTESPMHYVANTIYHASDCDYRGKRKGEPYAWDDVVYFGNSPYPVPVKSSAFLKWVKARLEFLTDPGVLTTNPDFGLFEAIAIHHKDNGKPGVHQYSDQFSLVGYEKGNDWTFAPFRDLITVQAWVEALNLHVKSVRKGLPGFVRFDQIPTLFSEGKERDLDAARRAANWPEATDEQLCLPREQLKALLEARLPQMINNMRKDIEACGFMWEVPGHESKKTEA